MSLAGPLSVLLLIGVPALWLESQGTITTTVGRTILSQVIWINVGWSVLNLIPMLPARRGQRDEVGARPGHQGSGSPAG